MSNPIHASSFPYCFRPADGGCPVNETITSCRSSTAAPSSVAGKPDITTCLYQTSLGLFAVTWSRNLFGRSFYLQLLPDHHSSVADAVDGDLSTPSTPVFYLHLKPLVFWRRNGSRRLNLHGAAAKNVHIYWDLSGAHFGTGGPEPLSGFYIAVSVDGEMSLLVGDSPKEAYSRTRAFLPERPQSIVLRREHVYGNKLYTTRATFNGRTREITIDFRVGGDPKLCFSVDDKRVLQIKHLKWKFRGNEKIEVDGSQIHVSWDVHSWLFENDDDGYALFMFKFEKQRSEEEDGIASGASELALCPSRKTCGFGFETKKIKKRLRKTARSSSSSSSLSSASSNCSSVMEWASTEETELRDPSGFSLLVYAWKS